MNLNTFFRVASPTTLASLIADCVNSESNGLIDIEQLEASARAELNAIVDDDEADTMISQAMAQA
jgi:hypothetical protein